MTLERREEVLRGLRAFYGRKNVINYQWSDSEGSYSSWEIKTGGQRGLTIHTGDGGAELALKQSQETLMESMKEFYSTNEEEFFGPKPDYKLITRESIEKAIGDLFHDKDSTD